MVGLKPIDPSQYRNRLDLPSDGTPLETIYELTPQTDQSWGLAIADIYRSEVHHHLRTVEVYTCLEGFLALHLDGQVITLTAGESARIEPTVHHWAASLQRTPARVLVTTIPPWDPNDHFPG